MKIRKNSSLWIATWNHRGGYQAPTQYVEVTLDYNMGKEKACLIVLEMAKKQSRLSDFPKSWSCRVTNLSGLWV
jgi:hypothetical protein